MGIWRTAFDTLLVDSQRWGRQLFTCGPVLFVVLHHGTLLLRQFCVHLKTLWVHLRPMLKRLDPVWLHPKPKRGHPNSMLERFDPLGKMRDPLSVIEPTRKKARPEKNKKKKHRDGHLMEADKRHESGGMEDRRARNTKQKKERIGLWLSQNTWLQKHEPPPAQKNPARPLRSRRRG